MKDVWKAAYGYLPVPIQNALISAYGYHYRGERFGPSYHATVAAFVERERWTADRMAGYLEEQLHIVLQRAIAAPHYADGWARVGITRADLTRLTMADLPRLPVLEKRTLRKDPYALVPDRGRGLKGLRTYHSSGSTGTPIKALCTRDGRQRFTGAREARSYRWAGTSMSRPRAMIGGQPIVRRGDARPPFYRYNRAERQVYLSAFHLAPAHIPSYVEGFNRYRPEYVEGYAFSQFLLARLMLEQGLRFDVAPVTAITSSERLTPGMKDVIQRSWGCRAYQEYGSVENCGLITECEAGGLHAHPDFGIIEIVDEDGQPQPPGVEGRILCTALLNDAQFLIRYEIGDTAAWATEPCPCGRDALPTVMALTGRVEDVVVGPDGREMVRFHGIFVGLPFVSQGQVVQEARDRFLVRVIAEAGFGDAQAREIQRRFDARLGRVSVRVVQVDELERTASGKVRAVISQIDEEARRPTAPPADVRSSGA